MRSAAIVVLVVLVILLMAWVLLVTGGELPIGKTQDAIDACSVVFSSKPGMTEAEANAEEKVFFKCMSKRGYEFRPNECPPREYERSGRSLWRDDCYRPRPPN